MFHANRSLPYFALLLLLLLPACAGPNAYTASPTDIVFPHQWEGDIDEADFTEPSGAVMHPERGTLFVVGDEGDIAELETDGTVVRNETLRDGADLEGVTCNPNTGLLYVIEEGAERIHEVDPETTNIQRTITINRHYNGRLRMHPDGDGIEGITFLPSATHPEGGVFIIAHQSFTLDNPEEPSALMRVEAPLRTGEGPDLEARIVEMRPMPIIDMSALHYDAGRDVIYALSDAHNVILTVDHDGQITETRAFPGNDQEGLAIDSDGYVYIAQDSGGILKVRDLR